VPRHAGGMRTLYCKNIQSGNMQQERASGPPIASVAALPTAKKHSSPKNPIALVLMARRASRPHHFWLASGTTHRAAKTLAKIGISPEHHRDKDEAGGIDNYGICRLTVEVTVVFTTQR
jgi:hypothetical protein